MRRYPCKGEVNLKALQSVMNEIFGNVVIEGESLISNMPGILKVKAFVSGNKEISIETDTSTSSNPDLAVKLYNRFLEKATGYSSKERKRMLSKV
jgi:hypothetical protein